MICFLQDETIKAHRLILTACSGFFRKAFHDVMPWQQPVVFLKVPLNIFERLKILYDLLGHNVY